MSYTPFNAPLLAGLLSDGETVAFFSVRAELHAMLRFEAALALAEAEAGVIPAGAGEAIAKACDAFAPDMEALGAATARDGVAVPGFVRQLRAHVGAPHGEHVHFAATSQDVVDTSLALRLAGLAALLAGRLDAICSALDNLAGRFASAPLMGRTRMQAAIPVTAGDRIGAWKAPLVAHGARLAEIAPRLARIQFGGAAGTLEKLGPAGPAVRRALAARLDLADSPQWHTDRAPVAEFAGWLSLVTGSLGKIGQDIALMAQNGIGEIALSGTGGSSAMAHKQNPVKAEALVTLARFNATLVSGLHQALVHEQERSGAAWTLEWMLLPQMAVAAGASTRLALELLGEVERLGAP